ncbi:MAG: filamentous hemagglutinin N-terminal domain-containing protein [Deltaproteobacteria bacterium]|nr:filamentous hemagglutinin N-terminal domain-containing protein [Deltaproteobacteria bacterium]
MKSALAALGSPSRASARAAPELALLLGLLWAATPAAAQLGIDPASVVTDIRTDGSFGAPTQVGGVGGVYEIPESLGNRPGGANGRNLFHSFERFDIATSDVGRFTAEAPTANVISRVTGGGVSKIFGTLEAGSGLEGADFYFLNPHGVVFGPGARLDVTGSFHVSTADELGFDSGEVFAARLGGAVPTMAVAHPVDFGFWVDDAAPAGIWFDKTRASSLDPNFAVGDGDTLSVVAGQIEMAGPGGESRANVAAIGGVVQLAAAPAGSRIPVDLNELEDVEALRSDAALIRFTGGGGARVAGSGSEAPARIAIRAGRFEMVRDQLGGASGILQAQATGREPAGSLAIDVEVAGAIELARGRILSSTTASNSSGDIRLAGERVVLADGTIARGQILDTGNENPGPGIVVDAGDGAVEILGGSQLRVEDEIENGNSKGKVGDIRVIASELNIAGSRVVEIGGVDVAIGSAILATSRGDGDAAVVRVDADRIDLSDAGEIKAVRLQNLLSLDVVPEDAGRIEVHAGELQITDGAIGSVTQGAGRGADVSVVADTIRVASTGTPGATGEVVTGQISTLTQRSDFMGFELNGGRGGDLSIHAGSEAQPGLVELTGGGQIRAVTRSDSDAGNLELTVDGGPLAARGAFEFEDASGENRKVPSGVFSRSEGEAIGDGGSLEILADSVLLDDRAEISARTETDGDAGDLLIVARDLVSVRDGSTISARGAGGSFAPGGPRPGNGGNLTIDADVLEVLEGGKVSASASGTGDARDVNIRAREVLVSGEGSGVFAQALGRSVQAGRAGNLNFAPREGERMTLRVLDGGQLSVEGKEFGLPGDIDIRGADLVEVASGGSINARGERAVLREGETPEDLPELASDIRIGDTGKLLLSGGTITAETEGSAFGGTIEVAADEIVLRSRSSITSRSTANDGGNAGDVVLAAKRRFEARNSSVTTTAADAGGGRISIQAGHLVNLLDSRLETTVQGADAGEDAGDIDIPLRGDEGIAPVRPRFVVANDSIIRANAKATNAGNITIAANDVLISADSILEATSETGLSGAVRVAAPDSVLVSRLTPLPVDFEDPADRLLPPCVARTERTGSFVVQNREAIPRAPDEALPASLADPHRGDNVIPSIESDPCSVFEEAP